MKADTLISTYQRLRSEAAWRLIAADNGPIIIGLLQAHLYETEQSLPASIFQERIQRDLEDLQARGETLPQTAQAYIADWLASGYVERRFPPNATEEEYELSAAAVAAIRFLAGMVERRAAATESRLAAVIQQLLLLAEETDTNPESRIAKLQAEQQRISREIDLVLKGNLQSLEPARALERVREIMTLADELLGDFRRVRDEFERLNRDLRERILDSDGSRGEVLDSLFAGVDLIGESEAGRTFSAFWRLLTDPEQSTALDEALDQILSREFAVRLDHQERRFLLRLTGTLLDQGGMVHEVLQGFARSLKHFVQSREYLEQRRLNNLLREAQRAALSIKDGVKLAEPLPYSLQLSTSRFHSLSQWILYDPARELPAAQIEDGDTAEVDLAVISQLVAESEIDFRALKEEIRLTLEHQSQASIGDVLSHFPAAQGLGSVVGLLSLASTHGVRAEGTELVSWCDKEERTHAARIPAIYFLKERLHELA